MLPTKLFPGILVGLDVLAAVAYATHGMPEWRMVVYWAAAAALTYVVTF
jgi:hypothetical protein